MTRDTGLLTEAKSLESAKTKLIDTNTEDGVPVDLEVLKDAPVDIEEY